MCSYIHAGRFPKNTKLTFTAMYINREIQKIEINLNIDDSISEKLVRCALDATTSSPEAKSLLMDPINGFVFRILVASLSL